MPRATKDSRLPKDKVAGAAEYVAEEQWNLFRGGQKERAAQEMVQARPASILDISAFNQAKDKMFMALLDDSADVPLPKPLPDRNIGWRCRRYVAAPESDVLNLRAAKGVLKPRGPCLCPGGGDPELQATERTPVCGP